MILTWLMGLFVVLPLVELMVLLKVHALMGLWDTLALVILTGILGAWLAKAQGLMLLARIQRELAQGRMPAPQMIDGMMILIAGALLITPGLLTDSVGFLLLVPRVRYRIRQWLRARMEAKLRDGTGSATIWRI